MFAAFLFVFLFATIKADLYVEDCLNYTIYPLQYKLNIIPYIFKNSSYYHCDITIDVIANAPELRTIELDAKDLSILEGSIKVFDGNRDIVNVGRPYELNERLGKLYIYLREPLRVYDVKIKGGQYVYSIKMSFDKHVKDDSSGLFLVKYYSKNERRDKFLYTTRFSPNKAKYAFPCFDNPRFEAIFKFKVFVLPQRADMQYTNTSLVTSQIYSVSNEENYEVIDYVPSPQVALHQVGFHYSTFANQKMKAKQTNDTLIVWAPREELNKFSFILNYGVTLIDMIHEFAGVKRPLVEGPINIVAVPKDLNGYEIGSWNLLTNSASKIAYVNQMTSIKQLERLEFDLAQQLSRLWLGNPGEPQQTRWKEEWFKEGMATYMAYYFLAQYNYAHRTPINILGMYGLRMKQQAMASDWHHTTPSLASFNQSLAIEIPPRYKKLVTMKTGALWWMLENWLEDHRLQTSFVNYVNKMRGQYISLQDLSATLDRDTVDCAYQFFNGSTASRILNSWFHQRGYPVVNVNVLRDRTPNAIQLKQKHFSFNRDYRDSTTYLIPISYVVQNTANCFNCHQPRFTISDHTYTFSENLNGGWIILNKNASGYYRVNYDEVTWRLIAKTLKENLILIDEMNRAQIVNDVFALYTADEIPRELAEEILSYLERENSAVVWEAAVDGFHMLTIDGAACKLTKHAYWEWQEFMRKQIAPIFNFIMKDKDQQISRRHFRNLIANFATDIDYQPCQNYLKHSYHEHTSGQSRMNPDLREATYYIVANESISRNIKLNSIEMEDVVLAETRLRENSRCLIRLPYGEPRPLPIISTETPEPVVTEKYQTDKTHGNGSLRVSTSIATLAFVIPLLFM